MYFSDPKYQAEFDSRHSTLGVRLGFPNQKTQEKLLLQEIREALREGKRLFLIKRFDKPNPMS